ncbi:hypothetical protein ALC56_04656 [Trachymyrmex septentrionalis]|uniref:Uncharacterized protein n=1 Tax=Trachymyrmex septentrionalis TaxID=34720 RepID=A0A151JYC8_9HYME|nr:hypothetical protein ALC56_04656 [Trachymyrmex septentrionalis]
MTLTRRYSPEAQFGPPRAKLSPAKLTEAERLPHFDTFSNGSLVQPSFNVSIRLCDLNAARRGDHHYRRGKHRSSKPRGLRDATKGTHARAQLFP